jgi:Na+-driven multidrug efflux pump
MGLLTYDLDVIKLGAVYLFLMGLVQIPQNLSGVLNGALRGAGYTRVPMIVAGIGLWGIRIPLSWIMTRYFSFGIISIWVVMCIDLAFRFILSSILYRTRNIYEKELVFNENNS